MPEIHHRPKHLTWLNQLVPDDRLYARCACGHVARVSIPRLLRRFDPALSFAEISRHLVCASCGRHGPVLLLQGDGRLRHLTEEIPAHVP